MRFKLFLLLAFFVGFSSCSSNTSPSPKKVRLLLDWLPNPNHIPLFVGQEQGFFKEEGIDLDILHLMDPPEAIPYLQSKQVDVVLYYTPYTLIAAAREKNLRMMGTLIREPLDGVLYLSDVEKLKLSVCSGPFSGYFQKALEEKGVFFKEIKKLEVDPIFALMTGLVEGASGVYWNVEPIHLASLGKKSQFIKISELGFPKYPELIFVSRQDFLESNPLLSSKFQRALQKSIDFCRDHPQEAFSFYLEKYPNKKAAASLWESESWRVTLPVFSLDQTVESKTFVQLVEWMEEHSLVREGQVNVLEFLGDL